MVSEKFAAFMEAQVGVATATMMGHSGDRVTKKVLGVYRKRVCGNRRRLAR
jgi:hypothetical protein